jgi:hypothetical protein
MIATEADGSREIYQSDSLSTLDLPDMSGWYRIEFHNADTGARYDFSEIDPAFTGNFVFAGSARGAILRSLPNLVTDGTVPTLDASGNVLLCAYPEGHTLSLATFGAMPWTTKGAQSVAVVTTWMQGSAQRTLCPRTTAADSAYAAANVSGRVPRPGAMPTLSFDHRPPWQENCKVDLPKP